MAHKFHPLEKYLNISNDDKVIKYIEDLSLLHQLQNQNGVEKYFEQLKTHKCSGTFEDLVSMTRIETLFSCSGKPWEALYKALVLLKDTNSDFDLRLLRQAEPSQKQRILDVLSSGVTADEFLSEWLTDLVGVKDASEAIIDACRSNFTKQFQVLKIGEVTPTGSGMGLYPWILEVNSPGVLAAYLKNQNTLGNCLVVTVHRNEQHDWKSTFYLFLLYNGVLYSIDNGERRVNLDNTAGCRNPDRYIDRKYAGVWLPLDLLWDKDVSDSKALIAPGTQVYKLATIDTLLEETPATVYWLNMFMYVALYHIKTTDIERGVLDTDMPKLLEYSNTESVFNEESSCSQYLIDIYKDQCKAVVLTTDAMPALISTKDHVEAIISYRRKRVAAEQIQKCVDDDYDQNRDAVIQQMKDLIETFGHREFVLRALADKEYGYKYYHQFGSDHLDITNKLVDGLYYTSLLKWCRLSWPIFRKDGFEYKFPGPVCNCCERFTSKLFVKVTFMDYRQLSVFLNVDKSKLPIKCVQHLHQQNETYIGNSILDDVDPFDLVRDPWFRDHAGQGRPEFKVYFGVCKRCYNKYVPHDPKRYIRDSWW